jgi:hypothetical protein
MVPIAYSWTVRFTDDAEGDFKRLDGREKLSLPKG